MPEFILDTSGEVAEPQWRTPPMLTVGRPLCWSDLDAFTQGYIEAAFESGRHNDLERYRWRSNLGFSDLAPETLAAMLRDCAAAEHYRRNKEDGALAWRDRQNGSDPHFRPLTVYLGDDGKVYLS